MDHREGAAAQFEGKRASFCFHCLVSANIAWVAVCYFLIAASYLLP